jgi:penicillin-binding protein 2
MQQFSIRPGQKRNFRQRVTAFFAICLFIILMLLFRTAYLQIIKGDEYSTRADRNRVRLTPILPNRGEVYDRDFKKRLITNRKSLCITLDVTALPKDPAEKTAFLIRLANVLSLTTNQILERLAIHSWDIYSPKVIKENVDYRTITRIAEAHDQFSGVFWENRAIRVYTMTNTLSHLLGYTGYISPDEFKRLAQDGYRTGSLLGKTGIEQVYDRILRGREGVYEREVNARNFVTRQFERATPQHGRPLVLTIDSKLQAVAQAAMGKHKGAVIVSKPATGEVLALLSNPGYNANLFYNRIDPEVLRKIQKDPGNPLFNRAIQGNYPASSVFKLVTAIAGLETGRIGLDRHYFCSGGHMLGDRYFKCWKNHATSFNLISALQNSCDVYFYRASLEINPQNILHYARMFGLGSKTGIDLPGEARGFIPSREWKKKTAGRPWLDGDTLNLAIGQGDILVTPLQINVLTAALANNGIAYRPYLKKEVRSLHFNEVIERNPGKQLLFKADVSGQTLDIIRKSMVLVVGQGTGYAASSPKVIVAGKTGTAENPRGEDHAWFTCYAPANATNPDDMIAVTVVVEHGGGGGAVAAPVAACIIRAHFENKTVSETMDRIWKIFGSLKKTD